MANIYIKPETKTIKVKHQQHILAGSDLDMNTTSINPNQSESKTFDFFSFEDEEAPSKPDDDDWEEWEDEEDP